MKYAFIEPPLTDYPITKACLAWSVTASGFHAWKDRPEAQRSLDAQRLLFQIKTLFSRYQRRYRAPRIHRELVEQYGYPEKGTSDGNWARVKRLMRQAGLRAKAKRKFKATTDSNHREGGNAMRTRSRRIYSGSNFEQQGPIGFGYRI